jgi:hypothetical protein
VRIILYIHHLGSNSNTFLLLQLLPRLVIRVSDFAVRERAVKTGTIVGVEGLCVLESDAVLVIFLVRNEPIIPCDKIRCAQE